MSDLSKYIDRINELLIADSVIIDNDEDKIIIEKYYELDENEKNDDDCYDIARENGEIIAQFIPELEVVDYYCHRHKYAITELKLNDKNMLEDDSYPNHLEEETLDKEVIVKLKYTYDEVNEIIYEKFLEDMGLDKSKILSKMINYTTTNGMVDDALVSVHVKLDYIKIPQD